MSMTATLTHSKRSKKKYEMAAVKVMSLLEAMETSQPSETFYEVARSMRPQPRPERQGKNIP
jgi:hypothetical protein